MITKCPYDRGDGFVSSQIGNQLCANFELDEKQSRANVDDVGFYFDAEKYM